jgi:NAD(P)-dependent dehydrogenase (short-subunit alcohol dehydrogenase family)
MPDLNAARPQEFAEKVVVVTGGSAGIGRAIAQVFSESGARVVIAGRNVQTVERAAEEIERATGARPLGVQADVGIPDQCERLIDAAAERFGAVDILVNNAAYFALVPLLDADAAEASRFFHTNFCGPLLCGRSFARRVVEAKRAGVIVNVSSIAGARPAPGCGLYSATKAALDSLTQSMALEWTAKGIRVNGVAPGHVNTEGVMGDFSAGRLDYDVMTSHIPAGRIADVRDIANVVLFLSGESSRHVVGRTLTIDGGESL